MDDHIEQRILIFSIMWYPNEYHLHIYILKSENSFSCFSFTTHFHDSFVMVSTITHRSWFTYRHEGDHIITPCNWKSGTYSFFARTTHFLYRLSHTCSSQRPVGPFVLQFFLSNYFSVGFNNVIAHARQ